MNFTNLQNQANGSGNGWVAKISDTINSAMTKIRQPIPKIPPVLLLCEIKQRPGLSAISLTSSIISRLPEAGIHTGVGKDGSENVVNQFVKIICEELIKEIHDNAVVHGAIQPGGMSITGTGGNAGGPVTITGTNTNIADFSALIR